jgi:methionine aminopeptidase
MKNLITELCNTHEILLNGIPGKERTKVSYTEQVSSVLDGDVLSITIVVKIMVGFNALFVEKYYLNNANEMPEKLDYLRMKILQSVFSHGISSIKPKS